MRRKQQPAVQGSAQACQSWSSTWWEHPELACVEAVGASHLSLSTAAAVVL